MHATAQARTFPVPAAGPQVKSRRWLVLRRAASARMAIVGMIVLVGAVGVAVFAPFVAPYDPLKQDLANLLAPPSASHVLGTDNVGRDILARVIWGARVSLIAGAGSVAIAALAGCLLGLLAGYWRGPVDDLVMRIMDAVLSFPALVVVYAPTFARLMRGQVLTIRMREYVQAARLLGAPDWRILQRHVLPNAATPIVVQASLSVAFAILAEASLSFLGLGVRPPEPSWGGMINAGRGYLQQAPWIVFGPGAALFVTVLGLNFVGDAVRDALDPRS